MLLILTTLAVVAAAHFGEPFLEPIVFALVVGIVVAPLADKLDRLGIPRVWTASAIVLATIGILVLAIALLGPLFSSLTAQWPKIQAEIRSWMFTFSEILRGIETISEEIEQTVGAGDGTSEAEGEAKMPGVMDAIWLAPDIGARFFVFVGALFFFVLTRDALYNASKRHRDVLFGAERIVARYFALVTIINVALGIATGAVLFLIGMPGAMLWGLAAGVLNFILYLGPLVMIASLLVAGLIEFSGPMVLLPPALFMALNIIESQFVTPSLVGQRLDMNPLGVFLAVTFGLWLWGPIGGIVALPIALWVSVFVGAKTAPEEDEALI